MSIGDANDIQLVVRYLFSRRTGTTVANVDAAARRLAVRSSNVLGAGLRSEDLKNAELRQ